MEKELVMDRHTIASGLLRDLWRIYDHGGHSMRSARSQLLETDWPYCNALLRNVRRRSFSDFVEARRTYAPFLGLAHALNTLQGISWERKRQGNRLLMLAGIARVYEAMDDPGWVEMKFFARACMYAGLPEAGGEYREAIEGLDTYDLIVLLRHEDPQHRLFLEEFGIGLKTPQP